MFECVLTKYTTFELFADFPSRLFKRQIKMIYNFYILSGRRTIFVISDTIRIGVVHETYKDLQFVGDIQWVH